MKTIQTNIHTITTQIPLLQAIANKQIHINIQPTPKPTTPPTPLNLAAQDTLNQLHQLGILLTNHIHIHTTKHTPLQTIWNTLNNPHNTTKLNNSPQKLHIIRLLTQATNQLKHWTQPHPTNKLIGTCPNCHTPQWAEEHTTPNQPHTCPHCHTQTTQTQIINTLTTSIQWITGTPQQLSRILQATGIHIAPSTIRNYATKHKITPTGTNHHNHKTYKLGDIINTYTTNTTTHHNQHTPQHNNHPKNTHPKNTHPKNHHNVLHS